MSRAKDDPVFKKAKEKLGQAIEQCDAADVDKLIRLCDTLSKMKVAESKGKADPEDWGTGLTK